MNMSTNKKLWRTRISELLEETGYAFEPFKKLPAYMLGFTGTDANIDMLIITSAKKTVDEVSFLVIAANIPAKIDANKIDELLSIINKKNVTLTVGNFEYRPDEKKAYFKIGTQIWEDFKSGQLKLLIDMVATEADEFQAELNKSPI